MRFETQRGKIWNLELRGKYRERTRKVEEGEDPKSLDWQGREREERRSLGLGV
jgi:hypothetical protein